MELSGTISYILLNTGGRNQNAFLVQRNSAGGVRFSRDPLNPVNIHSRKVFLYSRKSIIGGCERLTSFASMLDTPTTRYAGENIELRRARIGIWN